MNGSDGGPAGAIPHFMAHRPDHSSPELLGDDELARAIDSLTRKLHSARHMLTIVRSARYGFYALIAIGGISILMLLPVPFRELAEGQRALATPWDVFVWWAAILVLASVLGAVVTQSGRQRRRRAMGWRSRVEELERRLDHAQRVLAERTRR